MLRENLPKDHKLIKQMDLEAKRRKCHGEELSNISDEFSDYYSSDTSS